MKTYFFMAGLPRSGSTLLSAILNQNPKIHSSPNSPVLQLMNETAEFLNRDEMYSANPKPNAAKNTIAGIIDNYYSDTNKPIVIDKNRGWPAKIDFITHYLQQPPKILCPVRDTSEILASFISMHRRNPFISSAGKVNFIDDMLVKNNIPLNDDNRCQQLAGGDGVLGSSYNHIKEALMKGYQKQLHFIEYNDLVDGTENTIRKVYDFLELDYYEHDYSNIYSVHQERDSEVLGFDDMHHVRSTINKISTDPKELLSETTINNCTGAEFWRDIGAFDEQPKTEKETKDGTND